MKKVHPNQVKDLINSEQGQKILRHTNNCEYCNLLQQVMGVIVEKHMEEFEQKENLK